MKACQPGGRSFRSVVAHNFLGGFLNINGLNPEIRTPLEVVLEDARGFCDLGGG